MRISGMKSPRERENERPLDIFNSAPLELTGRSSGYQQRCILSDA